MDSPLSFIRDGRAEAPEYKLAANTELTATLQGWARRPPYGQTLGATYLHKYKQDVVAMYNAGAVTSSKKMSPAQMREELQRRHPGIFRIPSRAELRSCISALKQKAKKQGVKVVAVNVIGSGPPRRGRQSVMPQAVSDYIVNMVKDDNSIKPKPGLAIVRKQFPQLSQEVTDKMIKSKISAGKQLLEKKAKSLT